MNHTTPMEPELADQKLIDMQKQITFALQTKVLAAVSQGKEYKRDLQSVGLSVELLDRLSHKSYEPSLYGREY